MIMRNDDDRWRSSQSPQLVLREWIISRYCWRSWSPRSGQNENNRKLGTIVYRSMYYWNYISIRMGCYNKVFDCRLDVLTVSKMC